MLAKLGETQLMENEIPTTTGAFAVPTNRPPTRAELDAKVGDAQTKLAELKRAQEELERERATLEEARRRQNEFTTGREEMTHHLTRGVTLLEEAEFAARRDAEQMARTLIGLRDALAKVEAIQQETWTRENWNLELTRALTTLENARMEWNAARLKWPTLGDNAVMPTSAASASPTANQTSFATQSFWQLCKIGLAFTWPLVLLGGAIFLVLLLRR